ncbi:MAG: 3-methyl-2-oxobutanoate hydroxymethyltransferase [Candidatus Hadarchaeales archaeon]
MKTERVIPETLLDMKERGEPIVMISTYDYITAKIADECGVDVILVGDSLAGPILGLPNTLGVTMDEMLHHTRGVARGANRAMVVGDMPFMSYQTCSEEAVKNAGRFVKEAGAHAVKVEGSGAMVERIRAIVEAGIPVMGHIGLTPQWVLEIGGYRVAGKSLEAAKKLVEDALLLEKVGVFCLVLECVPWQVAKAITERLRIPTIGCGAGPYCDGQVLVLHDLIGVTEKVPKFVKKYAEVGKEISRALREFRQETKEKKFPTMEHSYSMPAEEEEKFISWLKTRHL